MFTLEIMSFLPSLNFVFSDKENVNFENKFTSLNLEEIYQKKKIIKKN